MSKRRNRQRNPQPVSSSISAAVAAASPIRSRGGSLEQPSVDLETETATAAGTQTAESPIDGGASDAPELDNAGDGTDTVAGVGGAGISGQPIVLMLDPTKISPELLKALQSGQVVQSLPKDAFSGMAALPLPAFAQIPPGKRSFSLRRLRLRHKINGAERELCLLPHVPREAWPYDSEQENVVNGPEKKGAHEGVIESYCEKDRDAILKAYKTQFDPLRFNDQGPDVPHHD